MLAAFKFIDICSCSYIYLPKKAKIFKYISSYTYVKVGIGIKNCMGLHPTDHVQHDKLINFFC